MGIEAAEWILRYALGAAIGPGSRQEIGNGRVDLYILKRLMREALCLGQGCLRLILAF